MKARSLLPVLKRVFGYDSFRSGQEAIIDQVLAGRDVLALLPTGGGKSLCYQLPAAAGQGLTLVVSPLVALMKDQVDALLEVGVQATFLNSTVNSAETKKRYSGLAAGRYRLLYAAPERILMDGFLQSLTRWKVKRVAVDEAHCISEWGHDFRPEYRQLPRVREILPGVPFLALTATATERVRQDVISQLKFVDPFVHVGSFNRPNLFYRVMPKQRAAGQLLAWIKQRGRDSGIVYGQSRRTVETLAALLTRAGIRAAPYHAGMEAEERSRYQEAFLRDEIQVICATIAFGMGINKPNVRFVVHYDLPKSIEGYYQETGRAGRDGLPSECLLLFSPGDAIKYRKFIDEKTDETERHLARRQLQEMVHYAESADCRRALLLGYFGEAWDRVPCGSCDNCLSPKESFDGTLEAQKLMSCVLRIKQQAGFSVGLGHVVDVLRGASSEKIRRWGHERLSTYGIGKDHEKSAWLFFGRELIRQGLLQSVLPHQTLQVTRRGLEVLKNREKVVMTRPPRLEEPLRANQRPGSIECDEELFEHLRDLRRQMASSHRVPPYVIFSDVSLRWMARTYPTDLDAFGQIPGVGARKLAEFSGPFLQLIRQHLTRRPRQVFLDD